MFNLDTLRLIKKTFKRFLSLTLIVLIGTGFMMGLLSTPIIMKDSVDVFNDENNLQDIQIYSQYGFCYRDVLALMENEDVSEEKKEVTKPKTTRKRTSTTRKPKANG